MEFISNYLSLPFVVAATATAVCLLCALFAAGSIPFVPPRKRRESSKSDGSGAASTANCDRSVGGMVLERAPPAAAERQTGASMMEQLVPEIRTHALSYLDYPSLCRLSMTNSSMRKAANDDNAWKALYHKDFTLEQDDLTPINGWKAYYAATRAIVNVNSEFFDIIRARSLPTMSLMWLKADYVTCVHITGESFSGYNAVIQSWQIPFNWQQQQPFDFQVRDVKARVLTDMAWVTMKLYVDMETEPVNVTNVFEFHKGVWYMVHHHISLLQQIVNG